MLLLTSIEKYTIYQTLYVVVVRATKDSLIFIKNEGCFQPLNVTVYIRRNHVLIGSLVSKITFPIVNIFAS